MRKKPASIIPIDASVGLLDAEYDDDFLHDAFLEHPAYHILKDVKNPKKILIGRTGAGKTAILKQIRKKFPAIIPLKYGAAIRR